jgi:choline dehydrogenase-like flavoprotein
MNDTTDFHPQSFAVIGAGPVGCIVAAFLAQGGYEVTLCDVVPDLLKPALDPGIIIEGVEEIHAPGEGRFEIHCAAGYDLREAVFRTAVDNGWVLLELVEHKASLEDVFVRLTRTQAAVDAEAEPSEEGAPEEGAPEENTAQGAQTPAEGDEENAS